LPSMPMWSPVIRTEKSPARIACRACSKSCIGSEVPLAGLDLAVRRTEGDAPGERSLMVFPRPMRASSRESQRLRCHFTNRAAAHLQIKAEQALRL
jgi:hypothetical protein